MGEPWRISSGLYASSLEFVFISEFVTRLHCVEAHWSLRVPAGPILKHERELRRVTRQRQGRILLSITDHLWKGTRTCYASQTRSNPVIAYRSSLILLLKLFDARWWVVWIAFSKNSMEFMFAHFGLYGNQWITSTETNCFCWNGPLSRGLYKTRRAKKCIQPERRRDIAQWTLAANRSLPFDPNARQINFRSWEVVNLLLLSL